MREYRDRDHEGRGRIGGWKRERARLVPARIETCRENVVVDEREPGRAGGEVLVAPRHHAGVDVNAEVLRGALALLNELPRDSPTAATEVKDGLVRGRVEI